MFAVPESKKRDRVSSLKSSGSRVTSRPLPPQWRDRSQKNKKTTFPLFIRTFLFLQRSSSLLTFGAIVATLGMYGLTVYTQQLWNQEYQELESLQRHERNVTNINEALKDQIAESNNGSNQDLIPLTPDKNVYIKPTVHSVFPESETPQMRKIESPETDRPLAY